MGGILGTGSGQSRQPGGLLLPNAPNDFIFAVVGQEFGLVGGVAVIGLFLFFAYRGIRVALGAPDTFGGAARGRASRPGSTFQAFINIGVVVNLLPITGITLPFVSIRWLVAGRELRGGRYPPLHLPRDHVQEAPGTMRILIAAGGTGGHIYPALAVLRSLAERHAGPRGPLAGRPPWA